MSAEGLDVNTQAAILAASFIVSLTTVAVFAALLFGFFRGCCEGFFERNCTCCCCDMDDCFCVIATKWFCYSYCHCCMRDFRKSMQKQVDEMKAGLLKKQQQEEDAASAAAAAEAVPAHVSMEKHAD